MRLTGRQAQSLCRSRERSERAVHEKSSIQELEAPNCLFTPDLLLIPLKEGSHRVLLNLTPAEYPNRLLPKSVGVYFWREIMKQDEELVLKVTKEVVIKFIEIGRLSVNSFDEIFKQIHRTVHDSVKEMAADKSKTKK